MLLISSWRSFSISFASELAKYITVSSTYWRQLAFDSCSGKSLKKIWNNNGPNIDPCGTPQETLNFGDL